MAHLEEAGQYLKRAGSHFVKAVDALLDTTPERTPKKTQPQERDFDDLKDWAKEGTKLLKGLFGGKA